MLHFPRWKVILILIISVVGILYALPNLFPKDDLKNVPEWLPHKQINLGLDLQGGSHLLLQVDTKAVIEERVKAIRGDVRQALRDARIGYTKLRAQDKTVRVQIRQPAQYEEAFEELSELSQFLEGGLFTAGTVRDLDVVKEANNTIALTLTEEAIVQRITSAVTQSIEIIRRRIDQLGTTEPIIQRQGQDRVLVQVPGLQDPKRLKELIGKTAQLTFQLVDVSKTAQEALQTGIPVGSEIRYSTDDPPIPYLLRERVIVSGENLIDAQPSFDQRTNEPVVVFRFDSSGAKRFADVTQKNVGRPFAIVLDKEVISAPVIREPILGGTGQISGNFTVEEVNDLAILLRAGALPAPLTVIEERTVGPGLGADSVAAGKVAALIGLAAVIAFILVSYGLFGIFSVLALLINISLIVGVLSLLQATLTLPGIAGIVLTMGMAVDANVLIFERIREEAHAGKTAISAIDTGYSRALGTILDANITTFIAAAILFWLGSGPVRGFAVTLSIGIVTSVFTAFTVTRLMVSAWVRSRRPVAVPI